MQVPIHLQKGNSYIESLGQPVALTMLNKLFYIKAAVLGPSKAGGREIVCHMVMRTQDLKT